MPEKSDVAKHLFEVAKYLLAGGDLSGSFCIGTQERNITMRVEIVSNSEFEKYKETFH